MTPNPQAIDWFLDHAIEHVLPSKEALRARLLKGDKLKIYMGIDPTGPSIHVGHMIAIQKLAELQALGHEITLLIGDYTATIGDPTDKSAVRKVLTREEVLANCRSYQDQAGRILKFDGPNPAKLRFNSEWFAKMSFAEILELCSHFTVQQMVERDMFEKRIQEGKPVFLHEFLYPVMQGYDSVALDIDLEIGGNDQVFNMLAGRDLLKSLKGKEKFVMSCKLLVDATGKKMGKSEGNMIALSDTPNDAYGKIMSWTDGMIMPGFEILTDLSIEEVAKRKAQLEAGENPVMLKHELAKRVVAWAFGMEAAQQAVDHFAHVHQQGQRPEDMPTLSIAKETALVDILVEAGLVESKTEARRQIEQGGVRIDDVQVEDVKATVKPSKEGVVIQKGKRHFVKVIA